MKNSIKKHHCTQCGADLAEVAAAVKVAAHINGIATIEDALFTLTKREPKKRNLQQAICSIGGQLDAALEPKTRYLVLDVLKEYLHG